VSNGIFKVWQSANLSDICDIEMGQSPPSSTYNENGKGLPFFQGKAEFTDLYPEVRKWCSVPSKTARKNDILLSVRAPVGPTNLAPSDCCIGRGLAAISPRKGISTQYVLYAIRAFKNELTKLGTGTTFEAVSGAKVRAFVIPVAPSSEQTRITAKVDELFSDLDAGVASLERARTNLKRYRAAVLKAAFEGQLTEQWRKAHPTVEPAGKLLARILAERRKKWEAAQLAKFAAQGKVPPKGWKDKYPAPAQPDTANLPELPEGWCWAAVEQLSTKVVDGVHKKPDYVPNGIPFVTVRNLTAGAGISFAKLNYVTEADHIEFIKRANPEQGDILVSKDGTLGVIRVVRTDTVFSIFVSVAMIKPVVYEMSEYFGLALQSPQVQVQMVPKGSGLQHIHLEDLRQDAIPLAPIAEQTEIVRLVDERHSSIHYTERLFEVSDQRLKRLRQSILKRAFEGKLVPQDPNDEPASVLLARIRAARAKQASAPKPAGRRGRPAKA
jgi:type I restriction enzyme S subunit